MKYLIVLMFVLIGAAIFINNIVALKIILMSFAILYTTIILILEESREEK